MSAEPLYITPHETALAVIATSMKKSRLTLQTLIINSFMGGVLFSAGGMLYCGVKANNPKLDSENPGILNMLGGINFSIGLFYVVINGCDLFNSNILFFTVGWLRGAVSVFDLIVSWVVSWIFNLVGTLLVSYVICHLSGSMDNEFIKQGTIIISETKVSSSFIQVFLKGIAGNFFVCFAVYLQLMSKPVHVKFLSIMLPIYTFVMSGFSHVIADMFLMTTGMFNGANISTGVFIWKNLLPVTLGNIVGGVFFSLVIPFYLHLYVVEADRKQLDLPEYDAIDEQPELNVDSRVVRVRTSSLNLESREKLSKGEGRVSKENFNPPGVFPVRGMLPLNKEKTIMNSDYADTYSISENISSSSHGSEGEEEFIPKEYIPEDEIAPNDTSPHAYFNGPMEYPSNNDTLSNINSLDLENQRVNLNKASLTKLKTREKKDEEEFDKTGRFNPEKNRLGARLEKMFTRKPYDQTVKTHAYPNQYQPAAELDMSRRSSLVSSRGSLSTKAEIQRQLEMQNMTNKALFMADPVAGSADLDHSYIRRPSRLRYQHNNYSSPHDYDNDDLEEQSIGD
ncbi:hypothetical protein QEN19_004190 [Hanseniaspora menglaensis]